MKFRIQLLHLVYLSDSYIFFKATQYWYRIENRRDILKAGPSVCTCVCVCHGLSQTAFSEVWYEVED